MSNRWYKGCSYRQLNKWFNDYQRVHGRGWNGIPNLRVHGGMARAWSNLRVGTYVWVGRHDFGNGGEAGWLPIKELHHMWARPMRGWREGRDVPWRLPYVTPHARMLAGVVAMCGGEIVTAFPLDPMRPEARHQYHGGKVQPRMDPEYAALIRAVGHDNVLRGFGMQAFFNEAGVCAIPPDEFRAHVWENPSKYVRWYADPTYEQLQAAVARSMR